MEDFPTIYSFLREKCIRIIKYIIVTSSSEQSVGSIEKILANFEVSQIFLSDDVYGTEVWNRIMSSAEAHGTGITAVGSGSQIYDFGECCINVISDEKLFSEDVFGSLHLYVVHGNKTVLIEGITNAEIQAKLAAELKGLIKCDVLVSAGIMDSRSKYFSEETNPQYLALYSQEGEYPTGNVYSCYGDSDVFSTSANGTIVFQSDGNEIKLRCER